MKKMALAICAIAVMTACGGSDSAPTCAPSGTWLITDTRTTSSGGACATIDLSPSTVQISVDSAARTFTWTEDGTPFAGTINLGTCAGTVTAGFTGNITDEIGNAATLTMSVSRNVAFNGGSFTGSGTGALSTSGTVTGIPCSLNVTSTGSRQ